MTSNPLPQGPDLDPISAVAPRTTDVDALVLGIVRERLDLDPAPDVDLIAGGLLDSLALVELLVGLEEAFGMDLVGDDLEIEYFRTLSSISAFVAERLDATRDVG